MEPGKVPGTEKGHWEAADEIDAIEEGYWAEEETADLRMRRARARQV